VQGKNEDKLSVRSKSRASIMPFINPVGNKRKEDLP
jgi:hypothetical protein